MFFLINIPIFFYHFIYFQCWQHFIYGRQKLMGACVSIWTESHKICKVWVLVNQILPRILNRSNNRVKQVDIREPTDINQSMSMNCFYPIEALIFIQGFFFPIHCFFYKHQWNWTLGLLFLKFSSILGYIVLNLFLFFPNAKQT